MANGIATPKAGPGKGNRRTGASRGTPARRGSVQWRSDPTILRRVELTADLYYQPRMVALETINMWLQQQTPPLEPITLKTLDSDRVRAKELLRERVGQGMEFHLDRLQEVMEDAWRTIRRTPDRHGQSRAALYAVVIRCVEDMAKLDGTWGQPPAMPPGEQIDASAFGPSLQELLEAGQISRDEFRVAMSVLYQQSGGRMPEPRKQLPDGERRGTVIDGVATEVPVGRPPAPQASRGRSIRRGGSSTPPPSYPRPGDEPEVVDWHPDEE